MNDSQDSQGAYLNRYRDLIFPAKITAVETIDSQQRYSWVEQHLKNDGTYEDAPGGRFGTSTIGYALELNGGAASVDDRVWLRPRGAVSGQPIYEFQLSEAGFWARLVSKTVVADEYIEYGYQPVADSDIPVPITWTGSGSGAAVDFAYEVNDVDLPVVAPSSGAGGECCPDAVLPSTLVATLSNVVGSCLCLPASLTFLQTGSESYACTVDAVDDTCGVAGYAMTFGCGGSACEAFLLAFFIGGSTNGITITPLSCSCFPFSVAFHVVVNVPSFCIGEFDITFTAGADGRPSTIVWMRSGRGDYKLFNQEPRWEDVEVTGTEPVVIDGIDYYLGYLVRYDQEGKRFCRRRSILIRIATDTTVTDC